jgi:hypothetical protein
MIGSILASFCQPGVKPVHRSPDRHQPRDPVRGVDDDEWIEENRPK